MNQLFTTKSIAERGTMSQLKNDFNHRNVSTSVMNSFNYVDDFVRFLTSAHVVYLAMYMCSMQEINETPPETVSLSPAEVHQFFDHLCYRIVDEVWQLPSADVISEVLDSQCETLSGDYEWCICGEGRLITFAIIRLFNFIIWQHYAIAIWLGWYSPSVS